MGDFNYYLVMPVIVLAAYSLLNLLIAPFFRDRSVVLGAISLLGIGVAGAHVFKLWSYWRQAGPQETLSRSR